MPGPKGEHLKATKPQMQQFSERLRPLIYQHCTKLSSFADLIGIDIAQLSTYVNARRLPTTPILMLIADELMVSIDYLLGRTDLPTIVWATPSSRSTA